MPRWALPAFWGLLLVILAARIVAVFNEGVGWDEFALLHRAVATLQTGEAVGGGRPGLGTLLLVPFADGCRSALDALVRARLLWTAMVVASAAAFWLLLRAVLPPSPQRRLALMTGLGLWILAPVFLEVSIEVRTDQPAILFGLLGGLALLASRQRVASAALAGVLLAIGFLFTQKLLYVAGLVGALAIGQLLILDDWRTRREAVRAALAGAAFLLVVLGYRAVMARVGDTPAVLPVAGQMRVFDYYREVAGWNVYIALLPSLLPQLVAAVACLAAATAGWVADRYRGEHRDGYRDGYRGELATAWLVTLVALVVIVFHAGRFAYFYMVVGLFPATVGALVLGPVLESLRTPAARAALLALIWVPLSLMALAHARTLTTDTQQTQRDSLAFVERNFPPDARGFQNHGAFTCRRDPDPFPVRFAQQVVTEFGGPDGDERTRALIREFRSRPVSFLILPIEAFPAELWEFWATRYVHYHAAIHVPGRLVHGGPGTSTTFDVIVPGEYVWLPSSSDAAPLEVAGRVIDPGGTVLIGEPGEVDIRLTGGGDGILVLALPDPPSPVRTPFYHGW